MPVHRPIAGNTRLEHRGDRGIDPEASYRFTHAICRRPADTAVRGLRAADTGDPDLQTFRRQHATYVDALRRAGLEVEVLEPIEVFPDSVFVEDPALCVADAAIILRPGAKTRFGEREHARAALAERFERCINLPPDGFVEGGDILVTGREVVVGLSARTDRNGVRALMRVLGDLGLSVRTLQTPADILHFKSACGLLEPDTVLCTEALAATGCFSGYHIIQCPGGEEAAANVIRVNDVVLVSAGYPGTVDLLDRHGFDVVTVPASEAARLDGGLSCMSLRFRA